MIETIYKYTKSKDKLIEKLVGSDDVMINHVILNKEESLAEHYSDSQVYLIVTAGTLTITLDDQEAHTYQASVVNVPFHTKMNISNTHAQALEFFIVKAPHPRVYKERNV